MRVFGGSLLLKRKKIPVSIPITQAFLSDLISKGELVINKDDWCMVERSEQPKNEKDLKRCLAYVKGKDMRSLSEKEIQEVLLN